MSHDDDRDHRTTSARPSTAVEGDASATGRITLQPSTVAKIVANEMKKGDVLGVARFSGLQAARQATTYLPFVTRNDDDAVRIDFVVTDTHIDVSASAVGSDLSACEMHALAAVTTSLLTIFDMCKAIDRTMVVSEVALTT